MFYFKCIFHPLSYVYLNIGAYIFIQMQNNYENLNVIFIRNVSAEIQFECFKLELFLYVHIFIQHLSEDIHF